MKRLRGAYIMAIAPACEMYRAALARVAELESQLAAQQWRPVTEKPTDDGRYLIGWDYDEEAGAEVGDYMAAADMWFYQGAPATPTHWRPRPIPPLPNEVQP